MAFQGFGKESGPGHPLNPQHNFGTLPRSTSPSLAAPPVQPSIRPVEFSPTWLNYHRPSVVNPSLALQNPGTGLLAKNTQVQDLKRTRLPPFASTESLKNSRTVAGRPAFHFPVNRTQQNPPQSSYFSSVDSEREFAANHADVQVQKRTRLPPVQNTSKSFIKDSSSVEDGPKRPYLSPERGHHVADSQIHWPPPSGNAIVTDVAKTKTTASSVPKRTKLPLLSSDIVLHDKTSGHDDTEQEFQAKAKRLLRFKDEFGHPVPSSSDIRSQNAHVRGHDQPLTEKQKVNGEPPNSARDFSRANLSTDYEGIESPGIIIGFCPDMCPESERAERERKGDLDRYERVDGDRNQTSISFAVKKYNRTAERDAELIRPMPILQKTMDYLLNLLDQPYDDRFLGLYNFLWDRMRAIRMDLRMQHLFDLGAITMLEQMIRLHIIAMHELCQYEKGEGFSEGFDAHLNIEQMNKTSVELFQLYDDHRKRGFAVPTEKEFRGYYALLKLDKHPGYKVEPAELSLDLAKMKPVIRQAAEVLFARDVARACRTGNFIAFFRFAKKASYLQACLMHAHFGKLRSQALAALHSGLQSNQGIPLALVSQWLGMEEKDIEELLEYHGFAIKEFEDPYMVKEGPFLNRDSEYLLKCSKLVNLKKSKRIIEDVSSSPSSLEPLTSVLVNQPRVDKVYEQQVSPSRFEEMSTAEVIDEDMPDYEAVISQKDHSEINTIPKMFVNLFEVSDSFKFKKAPTQTVEKPNLNARFRNSLEKDKQSGTRANSSVVYPRRDEPERLSVIQLDSVVEESIQKPSLVKDLESEESTEIIQEEAEAEEVERTRMDEELAEAKLKLILRIWRRHSSRKKELREQKLLATNAALNSLSLGLPMWQLKEQPRPPEDFNMDIVTSKRYEKLKQSWLRLNVSEVASEKLIERNRGAKCLCWKIIWWSNPNNPDQEKTSSLDAGQWLRSKFSHDQIANDNDLVYSSPTFSIWKKWVCGQSHEDPVCCFSVIKELNFDRLEETISGAGAIIFLISENMSLEAQKSRLHQLLVSIPHHLRLPLLILTVSNKNYSNPSTIAQELGLHEVQESRISTFIILPLLSNGFLSDEQLRDGLKWLASKTPLQPVIRSVKTRELVLTHLNSSLAALDRFDRYKLSPNHCVSAINEALDLSIEEVANATEANFLFWPCPEIYLLDESIDEYRTAISCLPAVDWSSRKRVGLLVRALVSCKLPNILEDISWLWNGSTLGIDIEYQRAQLEDFLTGYLTQFMGSGLAQKEVSIMLQKYAKLELKSSTYYITLNWVTIFGRIFNWKLMGLSEGNFTTAYVLGQDKDAAPVFEEEITSSPYNAVRPSLDEMVDASFSVCLESVRFRPLPSPILPPGDEFRTVLDNSVPGEMERETRENRAGACDGRRSEESELRVADGKDAKESDRLRQLLEKCNLVQNMIEEKLSLYF